MPTVSKTKRNSEANLDFESKLWQAADKLRNNINAAEFKHVVLGPIFPKYISDAFEERRAKPVEGLGEYAGANPEDQDDYHAQNVFWVQSRAQKSCITLSDVYTRPL